MKIKLKFQTALEHLEEGIRHVMEDIETMVGGLNFKKRRQFIKEGLKKINTKLTREENKGQQHGQGHKVYCQLMRFLSNSMQTSRFIENV